MCRRQAESDRKLPCVSLRVWAFATFGSALAQKSLSAIVGGGGGEQEVPLGGLHHPRDRHLGLCENWDGSQFTPPTISHCVSTGSPVPKPPKERTHF